MKRSFESPLDVGSDDSGLSSSPEMENQRKKKKKPSTSGSSAGTFPFYREKFETDCQLRFLIPYGVSNF